MARREDTEGASESAADPTRREFFRTFGRQTVRNAGAVMGAAAELRRASGAAARDLLDMRGETAQSTDTETATDTAATFRSAYRLAEQGLLILDQRDLPNRMTILACSEPTEVASAIRSGAVNAGPVLGEIAAYALAAAAARSAERSIESRDQVFRAAANTLRGARREVHALRAAVDRMEARYDALTATDAHSTSDPVGVAAALRAAADLIASEAQLAHAALGRSSADFISAAAAASRELNGDEPINLLMHGDSGPLSSGMVGTGMTILQSLIGLGHNVHVWVTEAAPGMEGARVSALQLTQIDVPHTLIADTAVSWLLSSRRLDGVLLRADTVTANADTVSVIGSLNVARLAVVAGVAVYVIAPASAFDEAAASGSTFVPELRSPAESMAGSAASGERGRPAVFGVRLTPMADVVPGELVSDFLTESGPRNLMQG